MAIAEYELDEHLSDADPFDVAWLEDHEIRSRLTSLRLSLEAEFAEDSSGRSLVSPRSSRRRWRSVVSVASAAVVAVLVGFEVVGGGGAGGGAGLTLGVLVAAAAQLRQAAHVVSEQTTPTSRQWAYTESQTEHTGTATAAGYTIEYTDSNTEQSWDAPDGRQRARIVGNGFTFATAQDKAIYLANQAAFDAVIPDKNDDTGLLDDGMHTDGAWPTQAWETSPPTDPHILLTEMRDWWQAGADRVPSKVSPNEAAEWPAFFWNMLAGVLLNSPSSQLRATAYTALALVPGTKLSGSPTDALGRSGVEVTFAGDGTGGDMIMSPTTGDLLEMDDTATTTTDGLAAGTVIERWLFSQRGIVDSSTSLPDGSDEPLNATSNG